MTVAPGAYGLRLEGVRGAESLLTPARTDWPSLRLATRIGASPAGPEWVHGRHAHLRLRTGGHIDIDGAARRAVFTLPRPLSAEELVHPYLAPAAGMASHWLGRESFHAGAVAIGNGAWGVLGGREAGKSSLLALLGLAGHPVLSDDLLVVDNGRAFAGPRSIDLREQAADALGEGDAIGRAGARDRWRMRLGPVDPEWPLRGFIRLTWGAETSIERVAPADRLLELARQRALRLVPRDPGQLVALSALPMITFTRPRDWARARETTHALADPLAAAGALDEALSASSLSQAA